MRSQHTRLALCFAAVGSILVATQMDAHSADTTQVSAALGQQAFVDVARVLQSPRCRNCHPVGDAPLQGDATYHAHAMNITRASIEAGLPCSTCHQEHNSEAVGVKAGPPGAPNWKLPPKEMPMVFEKMSLNALCLQLKDPAKNGGRSFDQLLEHVSKDPLVLWGWAPGGKRATPPLPHDRFVAAFQTWIQSGGACPPPTTN